LTGPMHPLAPYTQPEIKAELILFYFLGGYRKQISNEDMST